MERLGLGREIFPALYFCFWTLEANKSLIAKQNLEKRNKSSFFLGSAFGKNIP
jgi:hypothetical protein